MSFYIRLTQKYLFKNNKSRYWEESKDLEPMETKLLGRVYSHLMQSQLNKIHRLAELLLVQKFKMKR